MSDIFDENEDMANIRPILNSLRTRYDKMLHGNADSKDVLEYRICTALALRWPGDDSVIQIIKDFITIVKQHHLNIDNIKF